MRAMALTLLCGLIMTAAGSIPSPAEANTIGTFLRGFGHFAARPKPIIPQQALRPYSKRSENAGTDRRTTLPQSVVQPSVADEVWAAGQVNKALASPEVRTAIGRTVADAGIKDPVQATRVHLAFESRLSAVLVQTLPHGQSTIQTRTIADRDAKTAMMQKLKTLAAKEAETASPRFSLEAGSGKLTFHRAFRVAGGEVKLGAFNVHLVTNVLAADL